MALAFASSVVAAPAAEVWAVIRDFGALNDWHPLVEDCRIEAGRPADQVGCVRAFRLTDGATLRERLVALSDFDFSYSYEILDGPMPLENYVATLKIAPITDGDQTFIEWTAQFDCAEEDEEQLTTKIANDVFQGGFGALKTRFAG